MTKPRFTPDTDTIDNMTYPTEGGVLQWDKPDG